MMSQQSRIDQIAPRLQLLVAAHNDDTHLEGCEALKRRDVENNQGCQAH